MNLSFSKISEYYDDMYVSRDACKKEVDAIVSLANKHSSIKCKSVLDIACGTGAHAQYLSEHFNVTGIDINTEMLSIAKKKLPTVEFVKADMCDFTLDKKFDLAVNLYGSIGFAENYHRMCASMKCVYNHLNEGGICILTPWSTKETFKEFLLTKNKTVSTSGYCRMETAKQISDDKIQIEMHHLIAKDFDISYNKSVSTVSLFSEQQYVNSIECAGFKIIERLSDDEFRMGAFVCLR